ncbi:hypothetical protein B9479_006622 [Cryptococcus floricola]|uniref:Ribosomal protein/NADH dehydrogenase domain-containing protein n=1 Tax=Cryptococcus floricola TaxID=2591691 RepID=A0A5D3ARE6_9TREE|nr:hypothetical protein B9479_006622 [Cryptococcus floricola]
MPALPKTLNRLPLKQAAASLRENSANVTLSPSVSALSMRFVAKNSEAGPRQFLRQYAPSLAYANPSLPILVHRIPDPRSKHKNPENPDKEAMETGLFGGKGGSKEMPKPEMIIEFHDGPKQVLPLSHLDGEKILGQLLSVAGEARHAGLLNEPTQTVEEIKA